MLADLHCHSTASDGALTPQALVARAVERGVSLLALTDHDTLDGLPAARTACAEHDLAWVSGVELSCNWNGVTVHVLGYDFALDAAPLTRLLDELREGRWQRAEEIARRLERKGMPDAFAGAQAIQQRQGESRNAPARPHFADFLVQQGYVRDRSEAFRKWLGAGKIGDVKQHWPSLEQGVATLREAKAWVSLAHPMHYELTRSKRYKLISAFVEAGGQALEVVNGRQEDTQIGQLAIQCREFGLLASAGSDFHAPCPWSELGVMKPLPQDLNCLHERFSSKV
ncbi:PHP domain-containing protein [Atopomonas sediminilitoris]|uniref:PHP domain-containing protein n=1 Tax=Atopomonas sediminilitoris TaxID=2919919 RepID=UPI001F4E00F9|nr:PHP domain-containing protein [Atopomonas sediminilitoris]MCJ8169060.1 PHP domain-containing protein [Atopomonas sediminilitoris]